ncbi:hypothetical protein BS47DRAFT_1364761 [Hydnum rufescens UP504]|uniref:Uncharacterized protein n=1 Tax=Hydnum rufescens UP504 TaxID=1448309 RepID=A0A9P6AQF3_9AGAM|nr:hypothetical protein BS47DRAFT_1364761 [Hydnum rufescens UP504]
MHYNWPKFEYLGGMKLKARETENWHDHPIHFINIKYTQILANYNAWKSPNSSLHMVFIIYPYELDNPQGPTELEQDHTPTTVGAWSYRFKVVTNNNNTKHLEINPQTHVTTDKTQHHTPAAAGVWCYLGDVQNGNASNEHVTDENAPRYIKYHTPATAGVWYYKILDLNPNEPLIPNLPNEHPVNEDLGPQGPLGCLRGCLGAP